MMNVPETFRFGRCGLCAEFKRNNSLISIDNKAAQTLNLKHKIKDCFDLDFQDPHLRHLSKHVCLLCCEKVDIFFGFKEQVRKAQKKLQTSLLETNVPDKNSPIKEEVSDCKDESLEYESGPSIHGDDHDDIKLEENSQENSGKNNIDPTRNGDNLDHSRTSAVSDISKNTETEKRKDVTTSSERKEERSIKRKSPRTSELNLESTTDNVKITEPITRIKKGRISYKWKCCICKKTLPTGDKLETHFLRVHKKKPQFSCIECSDVFETRFRLWRHHQKHGINHNYRCPTCSKPFTHKKYYDAHLEKHKKRYDCPLCDKSYKDANLLNGHRKYAHEAKREHECETCGKLFLTKSILKGHQRIHEESRIRYTCEKCGKCFWNLRYHMETAHTEEKPFCCPHCPKTFKVASLLKTHVETHNTEYKYTCETCGKAFRTKRVLRIHSIIHTDRFPYECEYCHKRFRRNNMYNVHKRQHTGERPYYCEECNMSFVDASNCLKHMKAKHNVHSVRKYADYLKDKGCQ